MSQRPTSRNRPSGAAPIPATRGAAESAGAGRERIVAAATLFIERGFAEISMQEISDSTGVTKGTLYHYFTGKEEVFGEVFLREMAAIRIGLVARLEAPALFRQRLESVVAFLLETIRPDVVRLIADRERHVAEPRRGTLAAQGEVPLAVIRPYFERAAAAGDDARLPLVTLPSR